MTKALVGHPFGSRKNVSNMNWPRKFRVEISAKFVSDHRVTVICERRGVGRITQRLPVQDLTAGSELPEVWGSLVKTSSI